MSGFAIKGGSANEQVVIKGSKEVDCGGMMKIESPKILIENFSGYKWYNELKEAIDGVKKETQLYHEGKYTMPEVVVEDPAQLKITDDNGDTGFDDNEL